MRPHVRSSRSVAPAPQRLFADFPFLGIALRLNLRYIKPLATSTKDISVYTKEYDAILGNWVVLSPDGDRLAMGEEGEMDALLSHLNR